MLFERVPKAARLGTLVLLWSLVALAGLIPSGTVRAQQVALATQGYGDPLSPAQITATQNNYAPAGCERYIIWRLSSDAARSITGISAASCSAAPGTARMRVLVNDGAHTITLEDEDAGSTDINRFSFAADVAIPSGQAAAIVYDPTESRWRLIGLETTGGGGGGGGGTGVDWDPAAPGTVTAGILEALAECPAEGGCTLVQRPNTDYPVSASAFSGATAIAVNLDTACPGGSSDCDDLTIQGAPGSCLTFTGTTGDTSGGAAFLFGVTNVTKLTVRDLCIDFNETCTTPCDGGTNQAALFDIGNQVSKVLFDHVHFKTTEPVGATDFKVWRHILARGGIIDGQGANEITIVNSVFEGNHRPIESNADSHKWTIRGNHFKALALDTSDRFNFYATSLRGPATVIGNTCDLRRTVTTTGSNAICWGAIVSSVDSVATGGQTYIGNVAIGMGRNGGGTPDYGMQVSAHSTTAVGNTFLAGQCSVTTNKSCWIDEDCGGGETCEVSAVAGIYCERGAAADGCRGNVISDNVFGSPGHGGDGGFDDNDTWAPITFQAPTGSDDIADNQVGGNVFFVSTADDGFAGLAAADNRNVITTNHVMGANRGVDIINANPLLRSGFQVRFVDAAGDDSCIAFEPGTNVIFENLDCDEPIVKDVGEPAFADFQPLEATLTDIADGTIAEDLVNTANPWADNEVANDITASNYLPLAGGTLTGDLVLSGDASEGLSGGGLADCDADNQTLHWDATTKKFSCGDDDGGAATGTLVYHVEGFTGCCGTTDYLGVGSNTANCNATIGNVDIAHAGPTLTVGNLKCRQKTDTTCAVTFTIMKNGSASAASTCTSTNNASCAASTTTDTIANGDTWAIRAVDDSSTCTTNCELSCIFTATF